MNFGGHQRYLGFHANLAPAGFHIKRRTESRDCLRKILLISAHFLTGAQAATTPGARH